MTARRRLIGAALAVSFLIGCAPDPYESLPTDQERTDEAIQILDISSLDEEPDDKTVGRVLLHGGNLLRDVAELDDEAVEENGKLDYEAITAALIERMNGEARSTFESLAAVYFTPEGGRPVDGGDLGFRQQEWDRLILISAFYASSHDEWADFFAETLTEGPAPADLRSLLEDDDSRFGYALRDEDMDYRRAYVVARR